MFVVVYLTDMTEKVGAFYTFPYVGRVPCEKELN